MAQTGGRLSVRIFIDDLHCMRYKPARTDEEIDYNLERDAS